MSQEEGAALMSETGQPGEARPMANATQERGIDPKLLELLVCPVTKATLDYDAVNNELVSHAAKLAYPIRDGIPIMLPEEARHIEG
jgi:uncharacterized protein YbaR (Trm112 family)